MLEFLIFLFAQKPKSLRYYIFHNLGLMDVVPIMMRRLDAISKLESTIICIWAKKSGTFQHIAVNDFWKSTCAESRFFKSSCYSFSSLVHKKMVEANGNKQQINFVFRLSFLFQDSFVMFD